MTPGLLTSLRHLSALSVADVSRLSGLSLSEVRATEEAPEQHALLTARLLEAYGLDQEALQHQHLTRADDTEIRLFFFQGVANSIDPEDADGFLRALRWGRRYAAAEPARAGLTRRQRIQPVPLDGDHPSAVAQQGHRLASWLRGLLGFDTRPLVDIVDVVQQALSIPVCVESFRTRRLRAAAVIGRYREAVIVLGAEETAKSDLVKVDVAHELCHILFDPPHQGTTLTLDRSGDAATLDLLESRARGFAAELLLPAGGLEALLGPPRLHEPQQAAALVVRTCAHFQTPRTLTIYHLKNRGYFKDWVRDDLLELPPVQSWEVVPVELPAPGAPPAILAMHGALVSPEEEDDPTAAPAARALEAALQEVVSEAIQRAAAYIALDQPRLAGLELSRLADDALRAQNLSLLEELFAAVLRVGLPSGVERALLVNTRGHRLQIPARDELLERVCSTIDGDFWRARLQ